MTNNKHANELEAQAMMYPQGDVFDALMAGAAALRGEFKVVELWKAEGLEEVAKIVGDAARLIRAEAARLRAKGGA